MLGTLVVYIESVLIVSFCGQQSYLLLLLCSASVGEVAVVVASFPWYVL